ncbi:hypothetical protein [Halodesulfovibrio sp.]|uniref:hypothetical protein n=1 Tax=Halodesulfovibrio sp. TaxID=1912772 RepID=UPI0025D2C425|nr:hypothetical protein [Halodesulfovibrio sp.]MCT4625848.1 hypothetical protein [Halodesulfovibrio sp.]
MSTVDPSYLSEVAKQILLKYGSDSDREIVSGIDPSGVFINIKIDDPEWNDTEYLDYRTADLLLSMQNDFLKLLSKVPPKKKYSRKDLKKNDQLVIKAKISSGCILFEINLQGYCSYLLNQLKDENTSRKHIHIAGAFAAISTMQKGCAAWLQAKPLDDFADDFPEEKKADAIEAADTAKVILMHSKETLNTLTNRLSSEGKVRINKEETFNDVTTLKVLKQAVRHESTLPFKIDGSYCLRGSDLPSNDVDVDFRVGHKRVDISYVSPSSRRKIANAMQDAIDLGDKTTVSLDLQITVYVKNGKIENIKMIGIGKPREESISPEKVLNPVELTLTLNGLKLPSESPILPLFKNNE